MGAIIRWVDEQTGLVTATRRFLEVPLPAGTGWPHTLGALALFLFGVQALTGVFLALYYAPTPDHAYNSVRAIDGMLMGRLVRGIHHYATDALALVVGLHLLRVFLWGAYKRPRQIIWVVGVLLLLFTMAFTITGSLLTWDQNGYWATRIRVGLLNSIPFIGSWLERMAIGGSNIGAVTLSRFHALHVFFLPGIATLLMVFHVMQVRVKGITPPWRRVDDEEGVERPILFYPDHMMKIAVASAVALAILLVIAMGRGASLGSPADPNATYPAHTHWYFLYLFEFVHLFPSRFEFVGAMIIPALATIAYLVLPYIDRSPERRLDRRPFAVVASAGAFIVVTALGIQGSRSTPKVPVLTAVEKQGQKIFLDLRCKACHGINSGVGLGGTDLATGGPRDPERTAVFIRNPQAFNARSIMPKTNLPPAEMTALVAYLRTIGPHSIMPTEPQIGPPIPSSHRSATFMLDHKFEVRKDPASCAECHQPRFCQSCHQNRLPESHLKNWLPQHSGAATEEDKFCQVCHDQTYCNKCHREMLHGLGWLEMHSASARKGNNEKTCVRCHNRNSCVSCHQGGKPETHALPNFMQIHGRFSPRIDCSRCHEKTAGKDTCATCHTGKIPHPLGFVESHGDSAKSNRPKCDTCHANRKQFCDGCHRLPMPHPPGFAQNHSAVGASQRSACMKCHQNRDCQSCHQSMKPSSHTPAFVKGHGKISKKNPKDCQRCHDAKRDCQGCHRTSKPPSHAVPDFRKRHGALAKGKMQDCSLCHGASVCQTCHQLPMPHPKDFMMNHAATAKKAGLSVCANCHKKPACVQCHGEEGPIILPAASPREQPPGSRDDLLLLISRVGGDSHRCPVSGASP